jgi:hypothetical protein
LIVAPDRGAAEPAGGVAWQLAVLIVVRLVLHGGQQPARLGYMTDELYFLDSIDRLQWGYVDHPRCRSLLRGRRVCRQPRSRRFCRDCLVRFHESAPIERLDPVGHHSAPIMAAVAPMLDEAGCLRMLGRVALLQREERSKVRSVLLARLANCGSPRLWIWLGVVLRLAMLNKVSTAWLLAGRGRRPLARPCAPGCARRWRGRRRSSSPRRYPYPLERSQRLAFASSAARGA